MATTLSVGIQLGAALGQVLGGVVGVAFAYSQVTTVSAQGEVKVRGARPQYALMVLVALCAPLPFIYILLFAPEVQGHFWKK